MEELIQVIHDPSEPEKKTVLVGCLLKGREREELIQFLKENKNSFTWSHEDMVGIEPTESVYFLNTSSTVKPVEQKQSRFAQERNRIIAQEVNRPLNT